MTNSDQVPKDAKYSELAAASAQKYLIKYAITGWEFRQAIASSTSEIVVLKRALWKGRIKRVVSRTRPTDSLKRKLPEPISPDAFDPWTENSIELQQKTNQIVVCEACEGSKVRVCHVCGGTNFIACPECGGSGKAISSKTGKVINCRRCRGTGRSRCSCRAGKENCPVCVGKGKVERWLEVEETRFSRVTSNLPSDLESFLPEFSAEATFSESAFAQKVNPIRSWSGERPSQTDVQTQQWLQSHFQKLPWNQKEYRLDSISTQEYECPVGKIEFTIAGKRAHLLTAGLQQTVVVPASDLGAVKRRAKLVGGVALGGIALGFAAYGGYVRHPYFEGSPTSNLILFFTLLLGLSTIPVSALLCLGNVKKRLKTIAIYVSFPLIFIGAITFLMGEGKPTVSRARSLFSSGRLEDALAETKACIDLEIQSSEAKVVHDHVLLAMLKKQSDIGRAREILDRGFYSGAVKTSAQREFRRLVLNSVKITLNSGNCAKASSQLYQNLFGLDLKGKDADAIRGAIEQCKVEECLNRFNNYCLKSIFLSNHYLDLPKEEKAPIISRALKKTTAVLVSLAGRAKAETNLEKSRGHCEQVNQLHALRVRLLAKSFLPEEVDKTCTEIEKRFVKIKKTQWETAKRSKIQKLRKELSEARANCASPGGGTLYCRDGSTSGCSCPGRSLRGCCSRHKGVSHCGCSAAERVSGQIATAQSEEFRMPAKGK